LEGNHEKILRTRWIIATGFEMSSEKKREKIDKEIRKKKINQMKQEKSADAQKSRSKLRENFQRYRRGEIDKKEFKERLKKRGTDEEKAEEFLRKKGKKEREKFRELYEKYKKGEIDKNKLKDAFEDMNLTYEKGRGRDKSDEAAKEILKYKAENESVDSKYEASKDTSIELEEVLEEKQPRTRIEKLIDQLPNDKKSKIRHHSEDWVFG